MDELTLEQRRELLKRLLRQREELGITECPLSAGQRALWFLHRLAPDSAMYNIVTGVRLSPPLDAARLQQALNRLICRHESLRTVFHEAGGVPIQRVLPTVTVRIATEDATGLTETELYSRAREFKDCPFDLAAGPLLRAILFDRGNEQVFLLAVHHIVFDAWSAWILLDDLKRLYEQIEEDAPPPPAKKTYRDFVAAQISYLNGPEGAESLAFWQAHLTPLPALSLATDYPRPPAQRFAGASQLLVLEEEITGKLRVLASSQATTLFTVIAAAYAAALHTWTGDGEFIVGMPVAGRGDGLFDDVIGCFVNVAPVRLLASGDMSFRKVMQVTKAQILTALDHARYPFSQIVERLQPRRDLSRSPIFQTTLNLFRPATGSSLHGLCASASESVEAPTFGSSRMQAYPLRQQEGAFDLSIDLAEMHDKIVGQFSYSTDLFRAETADRMANHYLSVLAAATDRPDVLLRDLPALTEPDRDQIVL
jgi:hypothetical protein